MLHATISYHNTKEINNKKKPQHINLITLLNLIIFKINIQSMIPHINLIDIKTRHTRK